eukprot:c10656_g1_i2.p1 GENE.c10656_g1_i2~~c10656_g1_i2.p1  ORF type:complete len:402 (-),score=105.15 c10656_g1_i2:164-1369(-)
MGACFRNPHTMLAACTGLTRPKQLSAISFSISRFSSSFSIDNPYTLNTYIELPYASPKEAEAVVQNANAAQKEWSRVSLQERIELCKRFMKEAEKQKDAIATDITSTMGKPLSQALGEVKGMNDRAQAMIDLAPSALADDILPHKDGFKRKISKEPVGVVFLIAPWNYPLLTAVNCIVPAVLAGNSVVIKHAPRTALCGDHLAAAFAAAGAPAGLVTSLHVTHDIAAEVIKHPAVGYVSFTGSVAGGRQVYQTVAANRFVDITLELGGKDPAYVAADANFEHAVATVVDGAFYNAGQSCCAVERVYVHHSLYSRFIERAKALIEEYAIGDPLQSSTSMGPMALPTAPAFLQAQVQNAIAQGAKLITGGEPTSHATAQGPKGRFYKPTVSMPTALFGGKVYK